MKKKQLKLPQYSFLCFIMLFTLTTVQAQPDLLDDDDPGVCFTVDPDDNNGDLGDGTDDAFDGYGELYIDGNEFDTNTDLFLPPDATMGPETYSGLEVTRKIYAYVGANCGSVTRYLECFENPTDEPIKVEIKIEGDLGSDSDTRIDNTSSCDNLVTPDDFWITSNEDGDDWEGFDLDNGGDPPLSFNMYGPLSMLGLDSVFFEFEDDDLEFFYDSLTIDPGATVYIMHFITQNQTKAFADSSAAALLYPDAAALEGLSDDELNGILNFNLNCSLLAVSLSGGGLTCSPDPLSELTVTIDSPVDPSVFPIQVVLTDGVDQTLLTLPGPDTSITFPPQSTGTFSIESATDASGCGIVPCQGDQGSSVTVSETIVDLPTLYDPSNND